MEKKYRFATEEDYKNLLNMPPPAKAVKERSLGGNRKSRYLPLFEQQATADFIFDNWNVIHEESKLIVNEIVVTVKLQYLPSYPMADIQFATGSASKAVQQDASTAANIVKPEMFPKGKKTNSLEYCLPASRAAAISNALTTLGNIFGRNLNRDTQDNYYKKPKEK